MKKTNVYLAAIIGCGVLTSCGMGATGIAYKPQANAAQTQTQTQTPGSDVLGAVLNQAVGGSSILSDIISTFAPGISNR